MRGALTLGAGSGGCAPNPLAFSGARVATLELKARPVEPSVKCIILGFGNVGRALFDLLEERNSWLKANFGVEAKVVAVVDRGGAAVSQEGLSFHELLKVKYERGTVAAHPVHGEPKLTGSDIVKLVDADVLFELTVTDVATGEPGLSHILAAIDKGLHVVTSNKGPLVAAFSKVVEKVQRRGVLLRYTATVGGALRVLRYLSSCLAGEPILEIRGVLNGTSNYVLTKMEEGLTMDEAIKQAQQMGIAEEDPSLDIDGIDTACKMVILANTMFGSFLSLGDAEIKGIRHLTYEQLSEAASQGKAIRLIGFTNGEKVIVSPQKISRNSPLCVYGTLNAVSVKTEKAGELVLTGPGAGPYETASTVYSDFAEIVEALCGGR